MNGSTLTLGLVGALAAAGALGRRGSRDALRATSDTVLLLPETDAGLPAVVIVDAAKASRVKSADHLSEFRSCVLGFIRLSYPHDAMERITVACDQTRPDGDSSGPLEVYNSAARKGWGPLTYDAALWTALDLADHSEQFNGYLVPDRNNVSFAAKKVWSHYLTQRKADVTSRKVVKTCPKHGYPKDDPVLDRMYKMKRGTAAYEQISDAYARGVRLLSDLEDAGLKSADGRDVMDREDLEQAFLLAGEALFGEHF